MNVKKGMLTAVVSAIAALGIVGLFVYGRIQEQMRIRALASPNLETRKDAAEWLAAVRCQKAVRALLKALEVEEDVNYPRLEPRYLFECLDKLAGPKSVPAFIDALDHGSVKYRAWVATMLGQLDPGSEEAFGGLRRALLVVHGREEDDSNDLRRAAASTLVRFGRRAVEPLLEALARSITPFESAIALGAVGPNARPASDRLEALLGQPFDDWRVDGAILWALSEMGVDVLDVLMKKLGDPDRRVRYTAVSLTARLGEQARRLLPVLSRTAAAPDPDDEELLGHVLSTLLTVEPTGATVLGIVPNFLGSSSAARREAAWKCIADILESKGRPAPHHLEQMIGKAMADPLPAVLGALEDDDAFHRERVINSFVAIGPGAGPAVHRLAQALQDPSPAVRSAAVRALKEIGPAAAGVVAPALVEALSDSSWDFCAEVEDLLLTFGDRAGAAIPILVEQLKTGHERHRVSRILVAAGVAAVPPLVAALERADAELSSWIVITLGRMGPVARGAMQALETLHGSEDSILALHVREALEKIAAESETACLPSRVLRLEDLVPTAGCGTRNSSDGGPYFWHDPDRCARASKR